MKKLMIGSLVMSAFFTLPSYGEESPQGGGLVVPTVEAVVAIPVATATRNLIRHGNLLSDELAVRQGLPNNVDPARLNDPILKGGSYEHPGRRWTTELRSTAGTHRFWGAAGAATLAAGATDAAIRLSTAPSNDREAVNAHFNNVVAAGLAGASATELYNVTRNPHTTPLGRTTATAGLATAALLVAPGDRASVDRTLSTALAVSTVANVTQIRQNALRGTPQARGSRVTAGMTAVASGAFLADSFWADGRATAGGESLPPVEAIARGVRSRLGISASAAEEVNQARGAPAAAAQ